MKFLQKVFLKLVSPTAWKVSKCGVFSGPYFPVFGLNTGKYRPKTLYLDNFHAVSSYRIDLSEKESQYNAENPEAYIGSCSHLWWSFFAKIVSG